MLCLRVIVSSLLIAGLFACVPVAPQPSKSSQQADVHYKLGISHLQGNNPTMALKELLLAVKGDSLSSDIHAALAQAYHLKKAYPQAEQHYLTAITLSNNDPRYHNNLASLYLDMELWDKAIENFEKASSNLLFLNAHVALTGKGYAYHRKHDYPAALQQFNEVIAIAPRYAQVYYLQSETYQAMGDNDRARRALERATDIAPGFVQATYQLGVLLMKEQQLAKAREKFERIVELAPDSEWGMKSTAMLRALVKSTSDVN